MPTAIKWLLTLAAADADYLIAVGILVASSLLNVAYLLSIVGRAFFLPPRDDDHGVPAKIKEAPLACVVPLSLTALACIVLFFQIDNIESLVAGAATGR